MQLVSLRKPTPKKKPGEKGMSSPEVDSYDHPFSNGLRIRLGPHEMNRLGNVPGKAGDYVKIVAVCKIKERTSRDVDPKTADKWERQSNGESAELVIEKLAVMDSDDDDDVLEAEFSDKSKQQD